MAYQYILPVHAPANPVLPPPAEEEVWIFKNHTDSVRGLFSLSPRTCGSTLEAQKKAFRIEVGQDSEIYRVGLQTDLRILGVPRVDFASLKVERDGFQRLNVATRHLLNYGDSREIADVDMEYRRNERGWQ